MNRPSVFLEFIYSSDRILKNLQCVCRVNLFVAVYISKCKSFGIKIGTAYGISKNKERIGGVYFSVLINISFLSGCIYLDFEQSKCWSSEYIIAVCVMSELV